MVSNTEHVEILIYPYAVADHSDKFNSLGPRIHQRQAAYFPSGPSCDLGPDGK